MKLQDLIHQLSETLEHWGNIEVDCLSFEVVAVPIPESEGEDANFLLRFTTNTLEGSNE